MEPIILKSVKKMLGLADDYDPFDTEIVIFINSAFSSLNQLGVGPETTVIIENGEETWESLELDPNALSLTKIYIFLKVKMLFDPPTTSFLIDAVEKQITQTEWRLREFHDETADEVLAEQLQESEVIL